MMGLSPFFLNMLQLILPFAWATYMAAAADDDDDYYFLFFFPILLHCLFISVCVSLFVCLRSL